MIRILTGMLSQISTIRRSCSRVAWAMVMMTWSISRSATSAGRSSVAPRTLTPWMTEPCFSASSSTKPTMARPRSTRSWISLAARLPARPAPTSSTLFGSVPVALMGVETALVALEHDPAEDPDREHAPEGEDGVHDRDRDRDLPGPVSARQREAQNDHRQERPPRRTQECRHLAQAHVAPHERVHPGKMESNELQQDHIGNLAQGPHSDVVGRRELESEAIGQDERGHQNEQVEEVLQPAAEIANPGGPLHPPPPAQILLIRSCDELPFRAPTPHGHRHAERLVCLIGTHGGDCSPAWSPCQAAHDKFERLPSGRLHSRR